MSFHAEQQDTEAPGWLRLLALIDEAAADGRTEFRPPFPALTASKATDLTALDPATWGTDTIRTCSVCDGPVAEPHQVWLSRLVATDVLPLLVNACSTACVAALPTPHTGGPDIVQPATPMVNFPDGRPRLPR